MPGVPAVPGSRLLKETVLRTFSEGGPLAATLEGFEAREGQRDMAAQVAGTLEQGGVLLAEAGTGTGKTLAYLVPAILSRHRVLVSTGTKNLQEQILQKDLPLLERALGVPFTATCMKGRGNYLCLHRFETFRERPPTSSAHRVALALLEEWAGRTETGDRAEVDELPEDLPFWSEIAATTENCLGQECPRFADCFITRMRQRAAAADIVIVNHHLLCADAAVRHHSFGEVIPECASAVIDEAHQLEDVATQYFGRFVSNYRIEEIVRDGERLLSAKQVPGRERASDLRDALGHVEENARILFEDLRWKRPGQPQRPAPNGGLFDQRLRLSPELLDAAVGQAGLSLAGALDGLESTIALIKDASEDLRALGRRAGELRDELRFLLRADDEDYVYFLETRGRGVFLRASPINVASIVRQLLIEPHRAAVLTSATLAVNGRFDYVRARLGIEDAREIRLPSEFDYGRQAILYLPPRMPDPRTPAFAGRAAQEIVAILKRSEGRAFALFTSYATLREVEREVRRQVPYPVLAQGDAPRSILLERFKRTANPVLLATSSFWQGVDVVGETLSCVIIDKLPFASPADPLVQARIEAVRRRGGDPFATFQVPLAVLTLLQGLGRLLRHRTDRGVLAILDPRIRTMPYGQTFLSALPPAPVTQEIDDIARFFGTTM